MTLPEKALARLEEASKIELAMGRMVARPAEGLHAAGRHVLRWDAASRAGGIYFIRVQAGETAVTRRVAVLR